MAVIDGSADPVYELLRALHSARQRPLVGLALRRNAELCLEEPDCRCRQGHKGTSLETLACTLLMRTICLSYNLEQHSLALGLRDSFRDMQSHAPAQLTNQLEDRFIRK